MWNLGIVQVDAQGDKAAEGGGSGCSAQFPQPAYQAGLKNPSCSKNRASVDVSAAADYNPMVKGDFGGISIYSAGCWTPVGGTSAATPLVAAIMARYKLTAKIADDFTPVYQTAYAFNDVTTGNNDPSAKCTDINCTAGVGWDGPTGMGTPNGYGLCVLAGQCDAGGLPMPGTDAGDGTDAGGGGDDGTDAGLSTDSGSGGGLGGGGGGTGGGADSGTDDGADGGDGDTGGTGNSGGCNTNGSPLNVGTGAGAVLLGLAVLATRRRRR